MSRLAAGLALGALVLGGCRKEPEPHTLTVFAASSLRQAFEGLVPQFERQNPGTKVQFSFAGSQELRSQLSHGAKADVFASADAIHMQAASSEGTVRNAQRWLCNELVIVVPVDNPGQVESLEGLARTERVVLAAPEVPAGRYARQVLVRARTQLGKDFPSQVEKHVVSQELNVRQVLTKVTLGEANAGIVYRTDALSAGDKVRIISIPAEWNVQAEYWLATTSTPQAPVLAQRWLDHLTASTASLQPLGFVACHP